MVYIGLDDILLSAYINELIYCCCQIYLFKLVLEISSPLGNELFP